MTKNLNKIRDEILEAALPDAPFNGWTWEAVRKAAETAGYKSDMAQAAFPGKLKDVLSHFSDWADRAMLQSLKEIDPENLKVRERIKEAVKARLVALQPYKEAERAAAAYWMRPLRKWEGARIIWRTADRIWDWAGDKSTDYNRYTKRGLLSGVLASTMLAWFNDKTPNLQPTLAFLDRRIENVMQLGKIVSPFKNRRP